MKKLLIILLCVSSLVIAKETDRYEACQALNTSFTMVDKALTYLDALERECDDSWSVYYHLLPALINAHNFKVGCEVGVSFGSHCKRILETTHVEKLYGIDPYLNYGDPTNAVMSDFYFEAFHYKVCDKLKEFGSRFELIRDFSTKAQHRFADNELDFVFLDANHAYEYVLEDLKLWYPKVKPGGIIAGDDYATRHPGVPKAVNEFFAQQNLFVHVDTQQPRFWWVQKPY